MTKHTLKLDGKMTKYPTNLAGKMTFFNFYCCNIQKNECFIILITKYYKNERAAELRLFHTHFSVKNHFFSLPSGKMTHLPPKSILTIGFTTTDF